MLKSRQDHLDRAEPDLREINWHLARVTALMDDGGTLNSIENGLLNLLCATDAVTIRQASSFTGVFPCRVRLALWCGGRRHHLSTAAPR
jgi:hypothetical protein